MRKGGSIIEASGVCIGGRGVAPRAPRASEARRAKLAIPALSLAALLALALALALAPRAEAYVYWVATYGEPGTIESATAIARANLDGSGVKQDFVVLPRGSGRGGVALDDAHVYWANRDSIGRANLDGSRVEQSFIAGVDVSFASGVAVDDAHIYWVSRPDTPCCEPGTGAIERANLDGTRVDESFITGVSFPDGPVAVDGSHIYWTSFSPDTNFADPYIFPSRIGRANLDGTGVDESFIGAGGVAGVAIDDTHLWWAYSERFSGGIVRANLDGTGRESVIGGEDFSPTGVAVSDTHVYWRGGFYSTAGVPIGRAKLDGSRAKHELITGTGALFSGGVAVDELPFSFGKLKRNRRRGTAKLTVNVPGPGELVLAGGKKVKLAEGRADAEGSVKLPVKPKGKAKKRLNKKGKAKVKAKVTYTPDGGEPNTRSKPVRLIKRR